MSAKGDHRNRAKVLQAIKDAPPEGITVPEIAKQVYRDTLFHNWKCVITMVYLLRCELGFARIQTTKRVWPSTGKRRAYYTWVPE